MSVLSKFLKESEEGKNPNIEIMGKDELFSGFAKCFEDYLAKDLNESEKILRVVEDKNKRWRPLSDSFDDSERNLLILINHLGDKIRFYKEVLRIIEEKSVNVKDVIIKVMARKLLFKPFETKLDWTKKGIQEVFADFIFKMLLFHQEIYEDSSLGNIIKDSPELYTFLTKGVDQFKNAIFQGSSEEGLTIYNMVESEEETIRNFDYVS